MRKLLFALPVAAAVVATPALAQPYDSSYYPAGPMVAGAVVGTAVGVGLYNGWYGSGTTISAFPATAAGAAVAGGVAGVGTVALDDQVGPAVRITPDGRSALVAAFLLHDHRACAVPRR